MVGFLPLSHKEIVKLGSYNLRKWIGNVEKSLAFALNHHFHFRFVLQAFWALPVPPPPLIKFEALAA